jgi:hypothetical protein
MSESVSLRTGIPTGQFDAGNYRIIGCGSAGGEIAGEKDLTEVASSSVMSKTVYTVTVLVTAARKMGAATIPDGSGKIQ